MRVGRVDYRCWGSSLAASGPHLLIFQALVGPFNHARPVRRDTGCSMSAKRRACSRDLWVHCCRFSGLGRAQGALDVPEPGFLCDDVPRHDSRPPKSTLFAFLLTVTSNLLALANKSVAFVIARD